MNSKIVYFVALFTLVLMSCEPKEEKKILVKVFDKSLFYEDIKDQIPVGLSAADSNQYIQNIINTWIQKQIMVHYAEIYLAKEKEEIEKKATEYKNSLLISKFTDILVRKNLDSTVTLEEISKYYLDNQKNYILNVPILQGYIIKMPLKMDSLVYYKKILMRFGELEIEEINSLVTSKGGTFEDFTQKWLNLDEVKIKMSQTLQNLDNFSIQRGYIETQDENSYYILKINNYVAKGEIAPLEYVSQQITFIILKNRSEKIIETFKQNKYDDAIKNNQIIIYTY